MKTRSRSIRIAAVAAALTLGVYAAAFAHATVSPRTSIAGGRERYVLRVPNERDVPTTRVEIQFPPALKVSSFLDVPGWRLELVRDSAKRIIGAIWTGNLQPERFAEFTFTAVNPAETGEILWPVLQTYAGGEQVDWTGPAGTERPASTTRITAAAAEPSAAPVATPARGPTSLIAYVALALSILSLGIAARRGTKPSTERWLPDSRANP